MTDAAPLILVVDDEPSLIEILEPVLVTENYRVATASTGRHALQAAEALRPDLILLDLGLPDIDGKDVIATLRQWADLPIIVISARHRDSEKIDALDRGADDYVDKPFEIGVLMARIRVALRRHAQKARPTMIEVGPLQIDLAARCVSIGNEAVHLSPKEYDLLCALAQSAGQIVTHKRLLVAGWGDETVDTQYLRVYMGLLRQKIEPDPAVPRLIVNEPGIGYRLVAIT